MPRELAALTIWLPVTIVNTLNRRGHWVISMRRARAQRAAVVVAVLEELHRQKMHVAVPATRPKAIQFEAHIGRAFDGDGLQAALKSVRDGLIDAHLIHGDGPQDGHVFRYRQCPGTPRSQRGVAITIQLRGEGGDHDMAESDPDAADARPRAGHAPGGGQSRWRHHRPGV
jgi:hypothetical protein